MIYRFLADLVMLFHMAFILFVLLGAVLVLRWPRIAWIHLPAVFWAAWIQFAGGYCPLTPLENRFRRLGEQGEYETGFVDHYIGALIYPGEIPPSIHVVLGLVVLTLNIIVYGWMVRRRRRAR